MNAAKSLTLLTTQNNHTALMQTLAARKLRMSPFESTIAGRDSESDSQQARARPGALRAAAARTPT